MPSLFPRRLALLRNAFKWNNAAVRRAPLKRQASPQPALASVRWGGWGSRAKGFRLRCQRRDKKRARLSKTVDSRALAYFGDYLCGRGSPRPKAYSLISEPQTPLFPLHRLVEAVHHNDGRRRPRHAGSYFAPYHLPPRVAKWQVVWLAAHPLGFSVKGRPANIMTASSTTAAIS